MTCLLMPISYFRVIVHSGCQFLIFLIFLFDCQIFADAFQRNQMAKKTSPETFSHSFSLFPQSASLLGQSNQERFRNR